MNLMMVMTARRNRMRKYIIRLLRWEVGVGDVELGVARQKNTRLPAHHRSGSVHPEHISLSATIAEILSVII